jgi:hypothetical protein
MRTLHVEERDIQMAEINNLSFFLVAYSSSHQLLHFYTTVFTPCADNSFPAFRVRNDTFYVFRTRTRTFPGSRNTSKSFWTKIFRTRN